jgi:spore maturation protein SpmB
MSTISIPWGTATTFRAPIVKAGSTDYALAADWTYDTGDVKVSKDGGAFANIATTPSFVSGVGVAAINWTLTAAETEATEIVIQVIDSATKAVQDQFFRLQTTKAAALQVGVPQAAQSAGDTAITLDSTAAAQTDFYKGSVVTIISGDGANQARIITAYNGSTKVATIDRSWDVALTIGGTRSVFAVFPQGLNQAPTTTQIATEIFDTQTVETGMTFRGALRLMGAVLMGRRSGTGSGNEVFNAAVTNAKARVTATIDGNGNRTNVTTDQT